MTPTPEAERRDRIADALLNHLSRTADIGRARDGQKAFMPEITDAERYRIADAVLAADRDHDTELRAAAFDEAADLAIALPAPDCAEMSSLTNAWNLGTYAVADHLRHTAVATRSDDTTGQAR